MRFVERAEFQPGTCAALTYIGGAHPEGFIDTGTMLPGFDNHVYISTVALREAVRARGWNTQEDYAALKSERDELERELKLAQDQLKDADRQLDAVAVLKRYPDWRQERKPGRPPKAK